MAGVLTPDYVQGLAEQAQRQPTAQLLPELCEAFTALAGDDVEAGQRLDLLEALRPALWKVLAQFEQQELARALPFSTAETARWRRYVEAWSISLAAYLRALADGDGLHRPDATADPARLALLLQRVIRQGVQLAVACFRAYQPVEPDLWLLLHEHLRRAEQAGVAGLAVDDATFEPDGHCSVTEAWLHLLLFEYCDPYGFAPGQQVLANRWTAQLARHARQSSEAIGHGAAGYLVVRLGRGAGMRLHPEAPDPRAADQDEPRFIALMPAREPLKRLISRLRVGVGPSELRLGEDCTREEAEQVLERINRRWRTSARRVHPRRQVDEEVRIAPGLAAVHRYLETAEQGLPTGRIADLNPSRLVDQSPGGLGLIQNAPGQRLRCLQLVALVRPREVLIGSLRWLTVDHRVGGLRYGVSVISGRAQAVRVRSSATEPGAFDPGLLIPALPALEQPAALATVPGTFFAGRELECSHADAPPRLLRLTALLAAGCDYELIGYEAAD